MLKQAKRLNQKHGVDKRIFVVGMLLKKRFIQFNSNPHIVVLILLYLLEILLIKQRLMSLGELEIWLLVFLKIVNMVILMIIHVFRSILNVIIPVTGQLFVRTFLTLAAVGWTYPIKSIYVPNGVVSRIFENKNYQGGNIQALKSHPCLAGSSFISINQAFGIFV